MSRLQESLSGEGHPRVVAEKQVGCYDRRGSLLACQDPAMRGNAKNQIRSLGGAIRSEPALDLWKVSADYVGIKLMPDRHDVKFRKTRGQARQNKGKLLHELVDVSWQHSPSMDRSARCALLEGAHDLPFADASAKAGNNRWVYPVGSIAGQQREKSPSAGRAQGTAPGSPRKPLGV